MAPQVRNDRSGLHKSPPQNPNHPFIFKNERAMDKFRQVVIKISEISSSTEKDVIQQRLTDFFSNFHTPNHPPYAAMIEKAIKELNEKGGSSEESISNYIKMEYKDLPWAHSTILEHHLSKLCEYGEISMTCKSRYLIGVPKSKRENLNRKRKSKSKSTRGRSRKKEETNEQDGQQNGSNYNEPSQEESVVVIENLIEEQNLAPEIPNAVIEEENEVILDIVEQENLVMNSVTSEKLEEVMIQRISDVELESEPENRLNHNLPESESRSTTTCTLPVNLDLYEKEKDEKHPNSEADLNRKPEDGKNPEKDSEKPNSEAELNPKPKDGKKPEKDSEKPNSEADLNRKPEDGKKPEKDTEKLIPQAELYPKPEDGKKPEKDSEKPNSEAELNRKPEDGKKPEKDSEKPNSEAKLNRKPEDGKKPEKDSEKPNSEAEVNRKPEDGKKPEKDSEKPNSEAELNRKPEDGKKPEKDSENPNSEAKLNPKPEDGKKPEKDSEKPNSEAELNRKPEDGKKPEKDSEKPDLTLGSEHMDEEDKTNRQQRQLKRWRQSLPNVKPKQTRMKNKFIQDEEKSQQQKQEPGISQQPKRQLRSQSCSQTSGTLVKHGHLSTPEKSTEPKRVKINILLSDEQQQEADTDLTDRRHSQTRRLTRSVAAKSTENKTSHQIPLQRTKLRSWHKQNKSESNAERSTESSDARADRQNSCSHGRGRPKRGNL